MFSENDLLLISELQHLSFCERQWGLMHFDRIWSDNPLTVDGSAFHERADIDGTESRGDVRIARGLRLRSLRFGLTGRADVVEFHRLPSRGRPTSLSHVIGRPPCLPNQSKNRRKPAGVEPCRSQNKHSQFFRDSLSPEGMGAGRDRAAGVQLEGCEGMWLPFPVEYKRGKPKLNHCDEVQLCAQAICLEEMLGVEVPEGALFYGTPWKRYTVSLDDAVRAETVSLAARLHELSGSGITPLARYEKKCRSCSLLSHCMPKVTGARGSVQRYFDKAFDDNSDICKGEEV